MPQLRLDKSPARPCKAESRCTKLHAAQGIKHARGKNTQKAPRMPQGKNRCVTGRETMHAAGLQKQQKNPPGVSKKKRVHFFKEDTRQKKQRHARRKSPGHRNKKRPALHTDTGPRHGTCAP